MKYSFTLLLMLLSISLSYSQEEKLLFTYDAAGNQTKRDYEIITIPLKEEFPELVFEETDYLRIYPNPTYGDLKMEWSASLNFTVEKIVISDLAGQVWEYPIKDKETISQYVDLTKKAAGVYIVRFELSNKEIITRKIIKI